MIARSAKSYVGSAIGLCIFAFVGVAHAEKAPATNDAGYMAKVATAAPPRIVRNATIMRIEGSAMRTLRTGTNGFTCFVDTDDTPMCADANAMEWWRAQAAHVPAPDKTGFIYMLAGDTGASNTDPFAMKPEPGNHWIKTGPHVMIVGPAPKTMPGYPRSADPDTTNPYVMWPGTPYEHLMLPVK
jgi:hypothetical protein